MANATYLLGSNEYVVVELERTALSADFTPGSWTFEMALLTMGEEFDPDSAEIEWAAAVYEAIDTTRHTVKALLPDMTVLPGRYVPYVRMESLTETETPTILRASGRVTVAGVVTPTP